MEHYKNLSIDSLEDEIWSQVKGYEGIYIISNLGRIKTVERVTSQNRQISIYIKKQILNKDGYPQVILCNNGKVVTRRTHRIMGETFLLNKHTKPCINHKNGIKTDNRIENLEWCTVQENTIHSYKTGLQIPHAGKKGKDNILSKTVSQFTLDWIFLKSYGAVREAERETGVSRHDISRVCKSNRTDFTAGGFKWKYA